MHDAPPEVQSMFAKLWNEINQEDLKRREERAKADPLANKLTTVMENTSYRYIPGGVNGRGQKVWFCWSCHRNAAGFFLGWREVRNKKGGKRDQWLSRRTRKRCVEVARRRAFAFHRKHTPVPVTPEV